MVLYDGAAERKGVVSVGDLAPYQANSQLMLPMHILVCRQLVLASSHASVQWILLEKFVGISPLCPMITAAVSFFGMHLLALHQGRKTAQWGVFCEQALQQERKRLRPKEGHFILVTCFSLLLAILTFAIVVMICFGGLQGLKASLGVLGAALVHMWDLNVSLKALQRWREPQLACEFTEYPTETLPSSDNKPSTLTKKRDT